MRLTDVRWIAVLLCAAALAAAGCGEEVVKESGTAAVVAPPLPAGVLVDPVACDGFPGQSYALYLPAGYTPDRRWPVIYVYDPRERGSLAAELHRAAFSARPRGMWRWHELLPVRDPACRLALGEGDCPLLTAPRLGAALGLPHLYIKDESFNPTGSFKARGLAAAVMRATLAGARHFVVPTAGNAGVALSAYAARAGVAARVYAPRTTPQAILASNR